jgi:UDP:flavonoid glycosyltransferase YjiC (YdhE family)
VIPQGADQFVNAQRCVDAGLGRQLLPGEVTADAVREQVVLLLSPDADARYRAGRVADEIAATPGPDAWVGRLRTMAGDASPRSGEPGLGDPGGGVGE